MRIHHLVSPRAPCRSVYAYSSAQQHVEEAYRMETVFGTFQRGHCIVKRGHEAIGASISRLTKPITHSRALSAITDLARSKPQLVAENLALRHQRIVVMATTHVRQFLSKM